MDLIPRLAGCTQEILAGTLSSDHGESIDEKTWQKLFISGARIPKLVEMTIH